MSIDDVFEQILEKPGLYLGRPSTLLTFAFLSGYREALKDCGRMNSSRVMNDFQRWIERKFDYDSAQNWGNIILFAAGGDEREGFDMMKTLWSEFKSTIT